MTFVKYIKSAVEVKDYPLTKLGEIAFLGRSNAGKSSLINALTNQKIAHVSQSPGKTKLLSFFNFNDEFMLVDMPGYGFAKRSNEDVGIWQKMIEDFLFESRKLKGLVLVMDIRRAWDKEERMLRNLAHELNLPMLVALTKADKLNKKELNDQLKSFSKVLDTASLHVVSNTTKDGVEKLRKRLVAISKLKGDAE